MALGPAPVNAGPADLELARFVSLIFKHVRPRMGKKPVFDDEALARLTMPTLVILGGRDALLDSHDTKRRLERAAPRTVISYLPEAGHLIRDQTSRVVEFLRQARAA